MPGATTGRGAKKDAAKPLKGAEKQEKDKKKAVSEAGAGDPYGDMARISGPSNVQVCGGGYVGFLVASVLEAASILRS